MQSDEQAGELHSGDQNIGWDAPLKLRVLADKGWQVRHSVHTGDHFSRPPQGGKQAVLISKEAYQPNGNVTRWTATLEMAPFLGKMAVAPSKFVKHGVDFNSIAMFKDQSPERVVEGYTSGDWMGVTHPDERRVAHGMRVAELSDVHTSVKKNMLQNMLASVPKECHGRVTEVFGALFNLERERKGSWSRRSQELLADYLARSGVNGAVSLGDTVRDFRIRGAGSSSLMFDLFVAHYSAARDAYNASLAGEGEFFHPLAFGELPFYAVVRSSKGMLVRAELEWHDGDSPAAVIRRVRLRQGRPVAVLGKAIPFLVDILLRGSLVLPEGGSPYASRSLAFARLFQKMTGCALPINSLFRIRMHALDALRHVSCSFRLPEYLRGPFGTEWITGADFAKRWQAVVETAVREAAELSGKDYFALAQKLHKQNELTAAAMEMIGDVYGRLNKLKLCTKNEFSSVPPSKNKKETAFARRQAGAACVLHEKTHDGEMLRALLRTVIARIDAKRAEVLAGHLAVANSLPYWDNRPFIYWVDALPGWYEGIREGAELVKEEL